MLIIRNVEVANLAGLDVRIQAGRVTEIGQGLSGGETVDGRGGALIPGLVDHHIHLLALAAQASSVDLQAVVSPDDLAVRLHAAAAVGSGWIRAVGYHERLGGALHRGILDRLVPQRPLRVQHQSGSLWVFNSRALERLGVEGGGPTELELDATGRPTGRLWRGDPWLRARLDDDPPELAPIGRQLAACGVTGVTDASASTDATGAALLAGAHRAGLLPQRLTLMSHGPLIAPDDGAFSVGPLKILIDDHDLPDLEVMISAIARARAEARSVAVHCVTAAELALTLAAFEAAGARTGDRIEHGGVIPAEAIASVAALGLTVVTQPGFVHERGDRYLSDVAAADQDDLYRCASLLAAGIPVAGSSDAPYASPDPWAGIGAAIRRRSRAGRQIGPAEAVDPRRALALYQSDPQTPGGAARRVARGAVADLCLLAAPLASVLAEPLAGQVRLTLIDGEVAYYAG